MELERTCRASDEEISRLRAHVARLEEQLAINVKIQLALPDGTTLGATGSARLCADCLFRDVSHDGVTALKLAAPNGDEAAVLGLYNVQGGHWRRDERRFAFGENATLACSYKPRDASVAFDAFDASARWAAYEFRSNSVRVLGADDAVELTRESPRAQALVRSMEALSCPSDNQTAVGEGVNAASECRVELIEFRPVIERRRLSATDPATAESVGVEAVLERVSTSSPTAEFSALTNNATAFSAALQAMGCSFPFFIGSGCGNAGSCIH